MWLLCFLKCLVWQFYLLLAQPKLPDIIAILAEFRYFIKEVQQNFKKKAEFAEFENRGKILSKIRNFSIILNFSSGNLVLNNKTNTKICNIKVLKSSK